MDGLGAGTGGKTVRPASHIRVSPRHCGTTISGDIVDTATDRRYQSAGSIPKAATDCRLLAVNCGGVFDTSTNERTVAGSGITPGVAIIISATGDGGAITTGSVAITAAYSCIITGGGICPDRKSTRLNSSHLG